MSPHIVVFDSGIGGTSVLAHIQQAVPFAQFSYVMDNKYLPYGKLDKAFLNQRLQYLLKTLTERLAPVDILVVACNTASTQTLSELREHLAIPIVGVVPAIKPAANLSKSGVIGVLATPATVMNSYTHGLVNDFAKHCVVHMYGSTELVTLAEHYYWSGELDKTALLAELRNLEINSAIDQLVLGCTHFPILSKEISEALGSGLNMVDSGEAIARRVVSLLAKSAATNTAIKKAPTFYSTAPVNSGNQQINLVDL